MIFIHQCDNQSLSGHFVFILILYIYTFTIKLVEGKVFFDYNENGKEFAYVETQSRYGIK